jgi:hypothetical protein
MKTTELLTSSVNPFTPGKQTKFSLSDASASTPNGLQ